MSDTGQPATQQPPTVGFDVAGARAAGYSESSIASFLAQQSGFDIDAAKKAGYDDNHVIDFLAGPPREEPPAPEKSGTIVGSGKGLVSGIINSVGSYISGAGRMEQAGGGEFQAQSEFGEGAQALARGDWNKPGTPGTDALEAQRKQGGEQLAAAGTDVSKYGDSMLTPEERGRFSVKASSMIGGFLPYIGASLAGGLPAIVGVAGVQGYGEGFDKAKEAGMTDEQAHSTALITSLVNGGLMAVPVHKAMDVIDVLPAAAKKSVFKAIIELGKSSGTMVGFSELSKIADNAIAQNSYDPKRDIMQGVGEDLGVEATVGAVLPLAGASINAGIDRGKRMFPKKAETPVEPVTPEPAIPDVKIANTVMSAKSVDEAIASASAAAGGEKPLTDKIMEGKAQLDAALPNPQLEKLGKLFQGLNTGEVEKLDDTTYGFKERPGEEPIPLRVWDPKSAPLTETTISPEIAKAQRDYYTGEHGIDIVYFENDPKIPFDGVVDPTQPDTLFLSNDPSRNALQVGAHEFTHLIEDVKGPDGESLADILHQQISSNITDLGWDYAKTRFGVTAPERSLFGEEGPEGDAAHAQAVTAHFIKELAGDIGGEAPKFDTFIPRVMDEVEARYGKTVASDMFQKFMDGIRSAMETIKTFFQDGTNTVSQHLVNNLDAIHQTLAKMYAAKYGEAFEDPLTSEKLSQPFDRTSPAPQPGYEEAKVRATNLKRWIDELDAKRREDAKTAPDVLQLQAVQNQILAKVGGVEDRLTKAAAARLAFVRERIDARLNPKGDNYDMARVREAMVKEHQKMADATAVSKTTEARRVISEAGNEKFKFSPKLKLKEPPNKTKEMLDTVPGLKRVFSNLTPEEHKVVSKRTADKLVKLFSDLPSGEETAAVAFSGRAKRGWYRNSAKALAETFGHEDAPRFTALLAALSPQTSVESNLENALRTWVNWEKAGRPQDPKVIGQILGRSVQGSGTEASVLEAWRGNAVRSLTHPDPGSQDFALSGAKVNSFGQNLRNHVHEVTNDAWMATFAGIEGEALASARKINKVDEIGKSFGYKSPGYLALSAMVRDAAKVLTRKTGQQWTPAEVQETVWSWAKTLYERRDRAGEDRTTRQILKAADMTHEDVNSTPDFAKLLITGIYRKILEGGNFGEAIAKLESADSGSGRPSGPAVSVTGAEGSGFAQPAFERHLQRAAARLERIRTDRLTAKGVDPRDIAKQARESEISANLSAATNSIPGIRQLVEAANAGDESAGRLVNLIAHESLERLVASIPGAKLETTANGGLYGGALEPSIGAKVVFEERARGTVLAALAKFADNFNQEQIHVRQETIDPAGRVYTDGSYATDVYTFDLAQPLARTEIEQVIADSGLYGLNFNDRQMQAYYVGDPRDAAARAEFHAAIERARASLGGRAEGLEHAVERLWAYGQGEGAVAGYSAIGGDLPASTAKHTEVPRALAERQLGYEVEPSVAAETVTPQQEQLQRRIADHYDQLPDNDLKNPDVKKAYSELTKELGKQFDSLPVKVDVWDHKNGEPYKSSADMRRDILDNNHMWIFATSPESFGPAGADFTGHPLLEPSGRKSNNGHKMLVNDELRAVHDYFAHMMTASDFGPKGEEAAWRNHVATIDNPWARWALTSETRGQNSWVNFGAHVEPGSKLRDRPFARQKAALLPVEDTLTGNESLDAPMHEFMRTLPEDQYRGSLPKDANDPFADFSPRVTPQMREELIKKHPDFLSIFRRPGEKVPDKEPGITPPKFKKTIPINPDRVFKTNAHKIADEHADEVTSLETQAMKGVAEKKINGRASETAPVEPSKAEPAPKATRALTTQHPEGKGRMIERGLNGEETRALENEPQEIRARALVDKDPDRALRVAMRQEQPPKDLLPTMVYFELERRATKAGDADMIEKLRTSPLAKEVTTAARTVQSFATRDPQSAVAKIQEVETARESAAEARASGPHGTLENAKIAETEKAVPTIRKAVRERIRARSPSDWANFISSIRCN